MESSSKDPQANSIQWSFTGMNSENQSHILFLIPLMQPPLSPQKTMRVKKTINVSLVNTGLILLVFFYKKENWDRKNFSFNY